MTASDAKADILIIDDEVQIRRLLRFLTLESAGYRVREAETGAAGALQRGRRSRRPDAVILDLSLPDQSGLEVLRRLLRMEPGAGAHPVSAERRVGQDRGARRRRGRLPHQAIRRP